MEATVRSWTRGEKLLLVVLCGVVFLDALDGSLILVALPSIGSALDLDETQLQWIVSAYVLGYGGLLLLGGRCADLFGRRRVLVWGLVALIVASAVGTVVSDGTLLVAARFVKGASAAFTAPAALSLLTSSFEEGTRRTGRSAALLASAGPLRGPRAPRGTACARARLGENPSNRANDDRQPGAGIRGQGDGLPNARGQPPRSSSRR